MTEGVIWKHLIKFSIPMAIGLLFQQLYNTVDTIVVGKFVGHEALAAVGSTGSIINTLVGLCAGLSIGASVVISQRYGAHDYEKLHDAVHTTILVTFIMSVIATTVGILMINPMLRLMDTPGDVFEQSKQYLTIYFQGMIGLFIYNMGSGILRAVGDSTRPLYFLCFSAVLNTLLDLLFVIAFKLGVAGVAYATIISQLVSAILVLITLTRTSGPYAIHWKQLRIKRYMLKNILSIGFPSGIQQAITAFSNVFVQSYINYFGSSCMAGWACMNKLDIFIIIPIQSIAMASSTFVGQNFGASKLERARDGVRQALIISIVITGFLGATAALTRKHLLKLFSDEPEVIEYGARFVLLYAPFYITTCFNQIYAGALRGTGDARTPMIIMLSSFVVFRQIYLFVMKKLGAGFFAIAISYPLGWILCSILMIIYYRRSNLYRKKTSKAQ